MVLRENWRVRGGDENGHSFDIYAHVPGCLHTDLQRAGLLPDLYYRDNNESAQWAENCDAVYSCRFDLPAQTGFTHLRLNGLDVYATVVLNGVTLGETDDMHIPWVFPVRSLLRAGENLLEVRFRSPVKEVAGKPDRGGAFTTERLHTRRIQCTYGWDWVGRFVTMGIFRDVELITLAPDALPYGQEGIYVHTDEITPFAAKVGIELLFPEITGDAFVEVSILSPDGKTVFERKRRILENTVRISADIVDPALWYPVGYGEHPLYTLVVAAGGETRQVRFGIRKVVILEPEDIPGSPEAELAQKIRRNDFLQPYDHNEGSSSFWVVVNGVRVFCQGANWVPCEPFPSEESPEKIRRLITLAATGGVNMLRVWGGGIFERPEFYDACDEAGVMISQDFLMACGSYPEEEERFRDLLAKEARAASLALRNHPCLVWWSGDNENAVNGDENMSEYSGRRAALECIAPILRELDPHRPFLPSSPYGGTKYGSATRGTTHNTLFLGDVFAWIRNNKNWKDYTFFLDRFLSRFNAEQPALGMPFVSTLRRFLTDEDIFGEDTSMSEYHTKNNPCIGEITLYGYIERMAAGLFGDFTDGADRVRKMQWLQAEWVRVSFELFRRHAWYSSGIVYWMYNDCWPAANGWSIVDYYGCPKPAFYTFRRCAKPVIFSFGGPDENGAGSYSLHLCLNGRKAARGRGRVYLYDVLTGKENDLAAFTFDRREAGVETVWETKDLSLSLDTVILCDAEWDGGTDRAVCLPAAMSCMPFGPSADPVVLRETETEITITSSRTLPMAFVDPHGTLLSENGVFLKIGEEKTLYKQKV